MKRRRVNVRAIIWRDGKILAVRHRYIDGSTAPHWSVPGGGLDSLEALEDGVRREIFEELGVEAQVGRLLFIQQFTSRRHSHDEELEFIFHVKDSAAFDAIDLSKTSHGLVEIAELAFVDPKAVFILPSFLSKIDVEAHINGSEPVYIDDSFKVDRYARPVE